MKGKRRLAKNVEVIRAIFHEWDTAAPPPAFELPPSLVVETSTGIDVNGEVFSKLHSYWLIDTEHPISAEDFHGIMETMVEARGSDPDAKDLARVLRLPGSWHQKGDPHQVQIVGGCEALYGRDELIKAFPPPVRHKPDPKAPRPTLNGHAPPGLGASAPHSKPSRRWTTAPPSGLAKPSATKAEAVAQRWRSGMHGAQPAPTNGRLLAWHGAASVGTCAVSRSYEEEGPAAFAARRLAAFVVLAAVM